MSYQIEFFSFSVSAAGPGRRRSMTAVAMEIFEQHQGTHILQVCFCVFLWEFNSTSSSSGPHIHFISTVDSRYIYAQLLVHLLPLFMKRNQCLFWKNTCMPVYQYFVTILWFPYNEPPIFFSEKINMWKKGVLSKNKFNLHEHENSTLKSQTVKADYALGLKRKLFQIQ